MSKLDRYVLDNYNGNAYWFEEECRRNWHIQRITDALDLMEYLDGKHEITKSEDIIWQGRRIKSRKVVMQLCKPILTFQNSFLLRNPVTLTSDDADTLEAYKEIYKKGKYNILDRRILDELIKFGEVFEYLYLDDNGKIKSQLIKSCDGYPIYNDKGEYIAFIEHYIVNAVSYYTVYTDTEVIEYSNAGGDMHKVAEYTNLSGLPIRYLLPSESDELYPRADVEDWIGIIDDIEWLTSKYLNSFYKFLNPIPTLSGTKLAVGKDGEGAINPNIAGQVIQLDMMSEFEFATAKMDYQSYKGLYDTLHQNLLNVSMTPSISMNGMEVSNISEDSIRILYYMATAKAGMTATRLHEGFDTRWKKMKKLLEMVEGREYDGYIDCNFKLDIPQNDKEVIENLKILNDMSAISLESILEQSPYCYDITSELQRLHSDRE